MTESESSKLDELLQTALDAKKALNRRSLAFLTILVVQGFFLYQLLGIGAINKKNARIGATNSQIIKDATSPEAKAASDARLAGAINDIRQSIDCVGFYFNDEDGYLACRGTDGRLDAIRSGLDPFGRP